MVMPHAVPIRLRSVDDYRSGSRGGLRISVVQHLEHNISGGHLRLIYCALSLTHARTFHTACNFCVFRTIIMKLGLVALEIVALLLGSIAAFPHCLVRNA